MMTKPRNPKASVQKGKARRRAARRDHDALPVDWRAVCAETRPVLAPDRVWTRFHDYFTSADCRQPAKKNWHRAWRNWIRDERAGPHTTNRFGARAETGVGAVKATGRMPDTEEVAVGASEIAALAQRLSRIAALARRTGRTRKWPLS